MTAIFMRDSRRLVTQPHDIKTLRPKALAPFGGDFHNNGESRRVEWVGWVVRVVVVAGHHIRKMKGREVIERDENRSFRVRSGLRLGKLEGWTREADRDVVGADGDL